MAYQVDTTGAAYALDASPLMKIQDKMAATQMASIQGAQAGAMAGLKAIEDYQARKQMANLQTQVSSLKPGSPTFETDIAKLVFSNPLAFNNENTAQTARTGLSLLGQAHAARLRENMRVGDRVYQTERDKAAFDNRLKLQEDAYKLRSDLEKTKKGEVPDVNSARSSIEGGGAEPPLPTEVAPEGSAAAPTPVAETPDPTAARLQIEAPSTPDPTQNDGQRAPLGPISDLGTSSGAERGNLLLLPPPTPEQAGTSAPPVPAGDQGATGRRGTAAPAGVAIPRVAAPAGVAIPRVAAPTETNRAMRKVPFSDQESELNRKISLYADRIKNWRSRGFNTLADQLVGDLANHQKALDELKRSPDYIKDVATRQADAARLQSEAAATAVRPDIINSLSDQHADIFSAKPTWAAAMRTDLESAKTATALQDKKDQWSRRLQMAGQADALPDDPKAFDTVMKREAAYREARDKLKAADVPSKVEALAALSDPTGTSATDQRLKAEISAARQEVAEGASKYEAAKKKVADEEVKLKEAKVKAGIEKPEAKPDPVAPPTAPKELSPFDKVRKSVASDPRYTITPEQQMNTAKDRVALDYPEVIEKIKKIAVEKPFLETKAVVDILREHFQAPGGDRLRISDNARQIFGTSDPSKVEEMLKAMVQELRSSSNPTPAGGTTSGGNNYTIRRP